MNRSSPINSVIVTAIVFVVLIVLNALGVLRPVSSLVGLVLEPISRSLQFGHKSALEKENDELRAKVNELTAEVAAREEAKLQNDALRNQLHFAQTNNLKLVQANIISQDPTNYQQFFTIDRGSSSGIQKGMVAVSQGLLVGRIIDTTPSTAKVYLITDFNSAIPALTQSSRASGLVRGQRGFGLSLETVPQTEQLKGGDTVITSGFGGDYPRGLVIGTVDEIHHRDVDVYQSATIRPAVDFRKLEAVFVITGQE